MPAYVLCTNKVGPGWANGIVYSEVPVHFPCQSATAVVDPIPLKFIERDSIALALSGVNSHPNCIVETVTQFRKLLKPRLTPGSSTGRNHSGCAALHCMCRGR